MTVIDHIETPKQKTAVALGVFDGVHIGHQAVIGEAVNGREEGLLPAAFTFSMGRQKPVNKRGQEAILTDRLKQQKLSELGAEILYKIRFDEVREYSPERFVKEVLIGKLRAARVVCGYDFRFGKDAAGDSALLRSLCEESGTEAVIVPPMLDGGEPVSSTRIRHSLKNGDIAAANRLLGYEYTIDMRVIDGMKNGRKLGFPTINQEYSPGQLVPRFGVYASHVLLDGKIYGGVTNIGVKPTIAGERSPLAETFIIGVDRDLYGQHIPVSLFCFLRGERKFSGLDELSVTVKQNIETVKQMMLKDEDR